eukprot:2392049-Rhodomonas_salina.1
MSQGLIPFEDVPDNYADNPEPGSMTKDMLKWLAALCVSAGALLHCIKTPVPAIPQGTGALTSVAESE